MKIRNLHSVSALAMVVLILSTACKDGGLKSETTAAPQDTAQYFLFRPKLEMDFGYSHAVKIGDDLKISGAVSMDDNGVIVGAGNMEQQMKNCYSDLEKILQHFGYHFDDVVKENVYSTNLPEFIKVSGFRKTLFKNHFPTGTWVEVTGLAVPGQLVEIEMEAHKSR